MYLSASEPPAMILWELKARTSIMYLLTSESPEMGRCLETLNLEVSIEVRIHVIVLGHVVNQSASLV